MNACGRKLWAAGQARPPPRLEPSYNLWTLTTPNADIDKAVLAHVLGPIDVAQINDDCSFEQRLYASQIKSPEFVPFGGDHQSVRAIYARIGMLRVIDIAEQATSG